MIRRTVDVAMCRRTLITAQADAAAAFDPFQLDDSRVENLPRFTPPIVEVRS
ncbi:MAG: hypothetical protein ACR2P0_16005 [Acidimicrobiales bacterium]